MPREERRFGASGWDWFWGGVWLGVIVQAIRNPGGCCCCFLFVALLILLAGGIGLLVAFSYSQVVVLIAVAYVLWRYVALPWLRERRGRE